MSEDLEMEELLQGCYRIGHMDGRGRGFIEGVGISVLLIVMALIAVMVW